MVTHTSLCFLRISCSCWGPDVTDTSRDPAATAYFGSCCRPYIPLSFSSPSLSPPLSPLRPATPPLFLSPRLRSLLPFPHLYLPLPTPSPPLSLRAPSSPLPTTAGCCYSALLLSPPPPSPPPVTPPLLPLPLDPCSLLSLFLSPSFFLFLFRPNHQLLKHQDDPPLLLGCRCHSSSGKTLIHETEVKELHS